MHHSQPSIRPHPDHQPQQSPAPLQHSSERCNRTSGTAVVAVADLAAHPPTTRTYRISTTLVAPPGLGTLEAAERDRRSRPARPDDRDRREGDRWLRPDPAPDSG